LTVPTIFITGPVGVGKTIVASDVSWLAEAAGIPHGGLDVDGVTWVHPAPPHALAYENVRSVWDTYSRAGATHLILAQVIYTRTDLDGFRDAVPGADITVFRLHADLETLLQRVAKREGEGPGAAIHRRQAGELFHMMEAAGVEDHLVQTVGRTPYEVASEIFRLSGWREGSDPSRSGRSATRRP
jgi:chloramphenicol 3-O-phosphotransferase